MGTTEVVITSEGTQLAPQVPPVLAGSGFVSSLTVSQSGERVNLALHLSALADVTARTIGKILLVEVSSRNAPAAGASPAPIHGVTESLAANDFEFIQLRFADVSEVAGIFVQNASVPLNDVFAPQSSSLGTSSLASTFGGAAQSNSSLPLSSQNAQLGAAQRLTDNIAIDRRLNAVILTGPRPVIDAMKAIIAKIDVPLDSVMLEMEVFELDENAARDIGIDFGDPVTSVGYGIQSLQTGNGHLGLTANLFAQISEGHGRVLSKPSILAQSGSTASILTGDAIPIITSVVLTGASSVTSQQVNYVNVGVNLQILPRISSDFVTAHIYSEVSSVTQYNQGVPQISQRQAQTVATVRDGQSFVVGGLLQTQEIHSLLKVPFIGDLPLIGEFFRHMTTTQTKTNLYILVTPHIVPRMKT
jgi:general secretion pathway protein D